MKFERSLCISRKLENVRFCDCFHSALYSALIKVCLCFITLWKVLLSYLMSWCHVCLDVDDLIFYMGAWRVTLGRPKFMLESKDHMWAQEFSSLASQILSFDNPLRKILTNKPLHKTKTHPPPQTQSLPSKSTQNTFETICCFFWRQRGNRVTFFTCH